MSKLWKAVGVAGGVVGAAATSAGVAIGVQHSRAANQRKRAADDESHSTEPLGELPPDRVSTVAADDGVPLYVEEIDPPDGGDPDVTVVFVHGFTLDRRSWLFQRRDLAKVRDPRSRMVFYDHRGHGRSGRTGRRTSNIEQLGRDLDAVLRSVVPAGPIVLVGHSMGGMTIMALAEQRPELFADRIVGVALISTSAGEVGRSGLPRPVLSRHNPVTDGLGRLARLVPDAVEWGRRVGGTITWGLIRELGFGKHPNPAVVDLAHQMIGGTTVRVITDFLGTIGTHNRYAALPGLRLCDVVVISGARDRVIPISHSELIAAEIPGSLLVEVPDAGHMVMLEEPELVSCHLAELLRRCVARSQDNQPRRWWKRASAT